MPDFSYRAIDSGGKPVTGLMSGDSVLSIKENLKRQGLLPVKIERGAESPAAGAPLQKTTISLSLKKKISSEALGLFCRQLAVITSSGVNLVKGLEIMALQTPDKQLRSEVNRIFLEVQKGRIISETMNDKGSLFPKLLVNMIATGEASGSLDEVLRNMAVSMNGNTVLHRKLNLLLFTP